MHFRYKIEEKKVVKQSHMIVSKELGMDKYLLPEDDGLPVRESGEWVKEKLFYVKRYIDVFEREIAFVDN